MLNVGVPDRFLEFQPFLRFYGAGRGARLRAGGVVYLVSTLLEILLTPQPRIYTPDVTDGAFQPFLRFYRTWCQNVSTAMDN